jgi:hypothetical protein
LARKVTQVRRAKPESPAYLELKVCLVLKVSPDFQVPLVSQALPVPRASLASLVLRGRPVRRATKATQVRKGSRAFKASKASKASPAKTAKTGSRLPRTR